jgi:hypothetical protein
MDVEIDVKNFTLDARWQASIEQRSRAFEQRFGAINRVAITLVWNGIVGVFEAAHFRATAHAELASGSRAEASGVDTELPTMVKLIFRRLALAVRRQRWIDDGVPSRCTWCHNDAFACVAGEPVQGLPTEALICTDCGRVESFVAEPADLATAAIAIVRARPASPYR